MSSSNLASSPDSIMPLTWPSDVNDVSASQEWTEGALFPRKLLDDHVKGLGESTCPASSAGVPGSEAYSEQEVQVQIFAMSASKHLLMSLFLFIS